MVGAKEQLQRAPMIPRVTAVPGSSPEGAVTEGEKSPAAADRGQPGAVAKGNHGVEAEPTGRQERQKQASGKTWKRLPPCRPR